MFNSCLSVGKCLASRIICSADCISAELDSSEMGGSVFARARMLLMVPWMSALVP